MSVVQMCLLAGALAAVIVGIKMMYCGHQQQVRRDRRSSDREPT